jgi:hypothetical protein
VFRGERRGGSVMGKCIVLGLGMKVSGGGGFEVEREIWVLCGGYGLMRCRGEDSNMKLWNMWGFLV